MIVTLWLYLFIVLIVTTSYEIKQGFKTLSLHGALPICLGIGHDRVLVRAAAGLDLADLARPRRIADVEDAQAPEPLWVRILGYTPKAAIDPAAGLLDRHDEDVAGDRHVPLSARADDRADQAGLVPTKAVEVEAVIIAEREQVAGKGHVGIGEIEKRRAFAELRVAFVVAPGFRQDRKSTRLNSSH